jgi:mannose-6-phosphate isomerase-like protein (cupin superfamily)
MWKMSKKKVDKTWGHYEVLHEEKNMFLVKKLVIEPEKAISYQRHNLREEVWYVIRGQGCLVLNDDVTMIEEGSVFMVPHHAKHKVINTGRTNMICVEVWKGYNLDEDDIERVG